MLTNQYNLNLPIQVWLNHDEYDYVDNPRYLSVTTLLKPTKQIILSKRYKTSNEGDVSSLIPAKYGTAVHASIEAAWLSPKLNENLAKLGINQETIKHIKVNPSKVEEHDIPIYLEQRFVRLFKDWTIGGKFDLIFDGRLFDNKTTSVWTYLYDSKVEDYTKQLSIYRWLNPDLVTDDQFTINYIFTDWSAIKAKQEADYPKCRIISKSYPLMELADTERFIRTKLEQVEKYWDTPDNELPECTDEELWRTASKYKYYKNPNKLGRATKVFDSFTEAAAYQNIDMNGKGTIISVPGSVRRCAYCSCFNHCEQKDKYLANGSLEC